MGYSASSPGKNSTKYIQNGTWKQKQTITKTKTKKDAMTQLYETSLLYIDFSTLNALEVGSFVRRT